MRVAANRASCRQDANGFRLKPQKQIDPGGGCLLRKHCVEKVVWAVLFAFTLMFAAGSGRRAAAQTGADIPTDKYAWLEDINGDKPLAWVKDHNARTAAVLEKDPHFAPLQAEALKVLESPDRLPWPDFHGSVIYNFWQDAQHVRGILRRTVLKDYLAADPKWETVLDYDALARQ